MKLDEMLGFDAEDPRDRHAEILVEEHDELLRALVRFRKENNISRESIAQNMGIDVSGVSRIESGDRDLHLSTIRRYAFACGAVIHHDVRSFDAMWRIERARQVPDRFATRGLWSSLTKTVNAVGASR